MGRIVVGTDGSESAAKALRWAVGEARRRDAVLTILHAWHPPSTLALAGAGVFPIADLPPLDEDIERKALHEEVLPPEPVTWLSRRSWCRETRQLP
jgi:nucleotide-binding universal stress UspA family protein